MNKQGQYDLFWGKLLRGKRMVTQFSKGLTYKGNRDELRRARKVQQKPV